MLTVLPTWLQLDTWNLIFMCGLTLLDNRTLKEILSTNIMRKAGTRISCKFYRQAKLLKFTIVKVDIGDVFLENSKEKQRDRKEKTEIQQELSAIENKMRSLRRTYQTVLEKCRLLAIDRMLTLTFKENVTDLELANKALSIFLGLARKKFGTFDYICVPEYQERGAVHYHIGLNRFYQWYTLLALWRLAINKAGLNPGGSSSSGGVYINKTLATGNVSRMSRYIGKYILKAIYDAKTNNIGGFATNKKRYYVSRGVEIAEKIKIYTTIPIHHWFIDNIFYGIYDFFIPEARKFGRILKKESEFEFKDWKFRESKQIFFSFV